MAAFLEGRIAIPSICDINGRVLEAHLESHRGAVVRCLEDVLEADAWARELATAYVVEAAA